MLKMKIVNFTMQKGTICEKKICTKIGKEITAMRDNENSFQNAK